MAIQTFITNKGADLIAKAVAGSFPISFIDAEIGTGAIGSGEDAKTYTALKVKYADAMLSNTSYEGNATCKFAAQYTASALSQSVLITEIGIFASDPDLGRVLFSYTNLGDNPDRLFPTDQATFYKFYDVTLSFTATSGVTVAINPSALVPASEVSATAAAGKILKMNSDGKLPADITGSATKLGGVNASEYSKTNHTHTDASQSASGFLSAEDKARLDTLNNRVNQDLKSTSSPTFAGMTCNGVIVGAVFQ